MDIGAAHNCVIFLRHGDTRKKNSCIKYMTDPNIQSFHFQNKTWIQFKDTITLSIDPAN